MDPPVPLKAPLPPPTTGQIYADYDRLIRRVEEWVATSGPQLAHCEEAQVRARIVQRVVELTSDEFSRLATRGLVDGNTGTVSSQGVGICARTGRVSLSARFRFASVGRFAVGWLQMLWALLGALLARAPASASPPAVVMDTPGGLEESDVRFARFCHEGPIEPLSSAGHIIVMATRPPRARTDARIRYERRPLVGLVRDYAPPSVRFRLLLAHLMGSCHFVHAVLLSPTNILLARDLSLVPLVRALDQNRLIPAMVITTSSFIAQPLWMKGLKDQHFKLHMLWYSQNFIPKMYKGEKSQSDLPPARHMRMDVSWVWTEGFGAYLRRLGLDCEVRVVGPILWCLPEALPSFGPEPLKIALFDVTPLPDGATPFGAFKNYYTVKNISSFVRDILSVCDEIESVTGRAVLVLLKHKRAPLSGWHAGEYLEYIDKLARERPGFRLIDHGTNLFGLLAQCDLSVSVPYTSTAYVAAALGKPALYYDPGRELIPMFESNERVFFADGPEELRSLMGRLLNVRLKPVACPAASPGNT